MPSVDLLYDRDCPNVEQARAHLLKAFARAGMTPQWSEHLVDDVNIPQYARGFGSPTILVDGRDVCGATPTGENSCRIYANDAAGLSRVPSVGTIATALDGSHRGLAANRPGTSWHSGLAVAPGIGAALVPTTLCPLCWPALAGVLSSLGLGFVMNGRWVLPVTIPLLVIAVGALALRAPSRRGYGPFVLGALAAATIVASKFAGDGGTWSYMGTGLLVAASVWNSWPAPRHKTHCPRCAQSV